MKYIFIAIMLLAVFQRNTAIADDTVYTVRYFGKDVQVAAGGDTLPKVRYNKNFSMEVSQSVLAAGKWAKVRVKTSGMKKLTRSLLAQMGFTDPDRVSVYGNGGTALPFANYKERQADLAKQPVVRVADGILFYAQGVETWTYSSQGFACAVHPDDEYSYYFITDGQEPSALPDDYTCEATATQILTEYTYYTHHEQRLKNLILSGREWAGEEFTQAKPRKEFTFDLPKRPDDNNNVRLMTRVFTRTSQKATYTITYNGQEPEQYESQAVQSMSSSTSEFARSSKKNKVWTIENPTENKISMAFDFTLSNESVWLDYITINSPAALTMGGADELLFRNEQTFKTKKGASEFAIAGSKQSTVVWNVTDCTAPKNMPTTFSNDTVRVVVANGAAHELVAFDPNGKFEEPEYVGEVANQNIHGTAAVNYIIVYHSDYEAQANRLADLHRRHSGLTVAAVNVDEIFNEFSSGKREVTAIRDFVKYIYDKDRSALRYLLLFGSGSYDNRVGGALSERNKIPTYQSSESLVQSQSYVTDDFYGWLDDEEGASDTGARIDIGIGRFPVRSAEEANAAVDKSEIYLTKLEQGAWKKRIAIVADDGDNNEHIDFAEKHASRIEKEYTDIDVERIYLESFASVKTSTGIEYPLAITKFADAINNGSLIINYVGHGGHNALTDEHLFKQSYISTWTNEKRLPFFITATCDFAPFDNNDKISAGEESFTYRYGGFIGLLTTTRLVYGDSNYLINKAFFNTVLSTDENGRRYSIGDAVKNAKIETGSMINSLKYLLIGDPAIVLDRGNQLTVQTDYVNGQPFDTAEPISALSKCIVKGSVRDAEGNVQSDFNGQVEMSLFDKRKTVKVNSTPEFKYDEYNSLLFNGITNVENGQFEIHFQLPKDINIEEGCGRVSYYAFSSDDRDAIGATNAILIGGIDGSSVADTIGPEIKAWIDYPEFRNGDQTGSNPTLYASISDESGINNSGLGIGHDITLIINGDRDNALNLNSYFGYKQGSYTDGTLAYRLKSLPDGKYDITLKAWDNANNSTSTTLSFSVSSNCKITFGKTELYPMPYSQNNQELKLRFSHNDSGSTLDVTVRLYSMSGQQLGSKKMTVIASNTQTDEINLSAGMPVVAALPKGAYLLKVDVDSKARSGSFAKKLIVTAQ